MIYSLKFDNFTSGSHDIQDESTIILDYHSVPTSNPSNQDVFMHNLAVEVESNTKDENRDRHIYYVLGGVAGGVIFISIVVLIVVIILKRSVSAVSIVYLFQFVLCCHNLLLNAKRAHKDVILK